MIVESAQGATKLIEALEKLGDWAGGATSGGGPSGPPAREVVRAFEEALEAAPVQPGGVDQGALASAPEQAGEAATLPGPAEQVPSVHEAGPSMPDGVEPVEQGMELARSDGPAPSTATSRTSAPEQVEGRAVSQEDPAQELFRRLDNYAQPGNVITPQELFRIQYLVGMLKVQVQAGLNSSQQSTQGMENLLRQSG